MPNKDLRVLITTGATLLVPAVLKSTAAQAPLNGCSVSVAARAKKVAEKYDMPKVVAEYLMAEQMNDHPIDVYFAAHRYGWLTDAESATKQCMSLTDLEGPGMYTREMEFVSAEVYYNLLKRHDRRYTPTSVSGVQTKKKRSRR